MSGEEQSKTSKLTQQELDQIREAERNLSLVPVARKAEDLAFFETVLPGRTTGVADPKIRELLVQAGAEDPDNIVLEPIIIIGIIRGVRDGEDYLASRE